MLCLFSQLTFGQVLSSIQDDNRKIPNVASFFTPAPGSEPPSKKRQFPTPEGVYEQVKESIRRKFADKGATKKVTSKPVEIKSHDPQGKTVTVEANLSQLTERIRNHRVTVTDHDGYKLEWHPKPNYQAKTRKAN